MQILSIAHMHKDLYYTRVLICIIYSNLMYEYHNMYIYTHAILSGEGGCCERQNLSCKLPFLYSTSCLLPAEHET